MSFFRDTFLVKLAWSYILFLSSTFSFPPTPTSDRYIDLLGKYRHPSRLTLCLMKKGCTFHWMRYVMWWVARHSLAGFRLWDLFINAVLSLSCAVETLRFPNHCHIMCWKAGIWRCISTERNTGLDMCHFLLLVSVTMWIHWVLNIAFLSKIQANWRLHVRLSLLSETWALSSVLSSRSTPRLIIVLCSCPQGSRFEELLVPAIKGGSQQVCFPGPSFHTALFKVGRSGAVPAFKRAFVTCTS